VSLILLGGVAPPLFPILTDSEATFCSKLTLEHLKLLPTSPAASFAYPALKREVLQATIL